MFCYKQVFFTCWYLEQLQIPTGITLSGWLLWDDASTFQYYFIELCFPHFYERKHPCQSLYILSLHIRDLRTCTHAHLGFADLHIRDLQKCNCLPRGYNVFATWQPHGNNCTSANHVCASPRQGGGGQGPPQFFP